ncbi:carbohydrate ABC transporter permease [Dactylosporangium sucinum]|uniref:Trehalose/maltose ABC transporter permease n=1 Tax=Dactylosporangium sucinum TaxID=1424081 RepID=A0A917T231_9ACTN|nr:sugar ABC transporter permease [Dactylosporangium sucinum]GGM06292.1 trehalose/maltose ABC transporter permease [Dactylosporangium sucinum]
MNQATLPAPAQVDDRRRPQRPRMSDARYALLLVAPAAAVLLGLVGWPIVRLVVDSFHTGSGLGDGRRFAGFDNYVTALTDPAIRAAAGRTLAYTVLVVAAELVIGLGMALLFRALGSRSRPLQTLFLYPLMIAPVVAGLLWRFLIIDNFGIVNELLARAGIIDSPSAVSWLSDPGIVLFSVALPDIWLTTSFMTLVLYAGLQSIPPDLYEAARLDGAGGLRMLWNVTLPLLRPVIAVALVIRGVDAARAFDVILVQTNGGPQSASETLSLTVYKTMVTFNDPGAAAAVSTLFMIVMMVVALVAVFTVWRPARES